MRSELHSNGRPAHRGAIARFDGDATEWDSFVRRQSGWTHFHLHGWRTVIERVFGHECIYLVSRDADGVMNAVLPLVRVRSFVFGHYLVSMPFLNYGGPLGSDAGVSALAAEAERIAAQSRVKLLELRSRMPLPLSLPVSHRKITVVRDLPADSESLWSTLPAKLRSQIKRPRKEGIEVQVGAEHLDAFYGVFAHHMRDLGTPVLPKRFFAATIDAFGDDVYLAVAYHQNVPVACGCGFRWNDEFEITWASALRAYNAMSPNMLVYWELMARMASAGARLFNFGRCTPGSGTHRFKMQWGGREETLWWYQRAAGAENVAESSTPSPDDGIYALATKVWQKLPVPIATRLGPAIVRSIP
jgi:FemAB-related protein (PEP-CTERM system-associated)